MTWEEAIEYFKMKVSAREAIGNDIGTDYEAYKIALSALRPVSREQVEKMWKGEWIKERGQTYIPVEYNEQGEAILHDFVVYRCSICGRENKKVEPFCNCGAPMTDEAVEMVMERMRETRNG